MEVSKGPWIPPYLLFPCALNINEDEIFITSAKMFQKNGTYIFNRKSEIWKEIGFNFPCAYNTDPRFSCAYLEHEHSVVTVINGCTATLNLLTDTWTSHRLSFKHGLVFNIDLKRESVFLIGSNKTNGSELYKVRIYL